MVSFHVLRKFYLMYSSHLNKEEYTQFIINLPVYDCTFWIAYQFDENGKPITQILLDFGFMAFRPPRFDVFHFQGLIPSDHRMLDHLDAVNWRRFLCRFGRDETCPLNIDQPWFSNALIYTRRQNVSLKQTDILNLYSPSGQAHIQQFSDGVRHFYAADTIVLDNGSQLQHLKETHRSIILHLCKTELEQHWVEISTLLQKLRTGQLTGQIPQSILIFSTQPLPHCGKLSEGRIDAVNLDSSILLGDE